VSSRSEAASTEKQALQSDVRQQGFYTLYGKRCFDAIVSAAGLILLSPLFLLISLCSKLFSTGPVFYLQRRSGKENHKFLIVKFRTMTVGADQSGAGFTVKGDARITSFGRYLRLSKIDELPQLWNVLKGEMSLVGPRPELPSYVANYSDSQRAVLNIRPGITDAASVYYRHEEAVLADSGDPESHYCSVVLPHKLALNIEYLSNISFHSDVAVIVRTLRSIWVNPSSHIHNGKGFNPNEPMI